jgi:molybdate transport system substrate-binding protein
MFSRLLPAFATAAILLGGCRRAEVSAPAVSIAAASNFVFALDALNAEFRRVAPGIAVTATTGSSGGLFAQIRNGAPFDVFVSADTEYPNQVVTAGFGDASTLRVFARGRLVAWTRHPELDPGDLARAIRAPAVRKVAMAQPRSAPYGRAAQAALEAAGVWPDAQRKLVLGENISQAAQFVETGNADLGLVALSLVLSPKLQHQGHWQEVPPKAYASVSLDHAVVLTTRGATNPAAKRYLDFLHSDAAKKILRQYGYALP